MPNSRSLHGPRTWITSNRPGARYVARPLRKFMLTEAAGGIVLLAAAAIALIWANSPWRASYSTFLHTEISLRIGGFELSHDLQHWINDGLMAMFFFVVGIEVKRELAEGELSDPKRAALPSIAALGGMVVPALIYTAFNGGGEASHGWGIPMATDIAFAVGVLTLFGSRVTTSMRVFLLTLAVADDIGAIMVIAIFYTSDLNLVALGIAVALLALSVMLRRIHVTYPGIYVALGVAVWFATLQSGVHATIAGVALGLLTPVLPRRRPADGALPQLSPDEGRLTATRFREYKLVMRDHVSVGEHLEEVLLPWSSFFVVPIFALANAGVSFGRVGLTTALTSPVTAGVLVGLVVGKITGITLFSYGAQRLGLAEIPRGVQWRQFVGVAAVAGIGFTVALFVTSLAFEGVTFTEEAKVGIFVASVVAALIGAVILLTTTSPGAAKEELLSEVPQAIER